MSPTQREILSRMRDCDEELVYENGMGYIGFRRVSRATVFALLRLCAIRADQFSTVGKFERYSISEIGRKLLEDHEPRH